MTRKVAVLMGGWSPEREVSLVSGKACAAGLREGGHDVVEYDVKRDLRALVDFLRPTGGGGGPDVVFNALHGRYGEDGCIQGVLEILAVPYTHSGVLASAIAMDKPMARHVFTSLGLRVAPGKVIERRLLAAGAPMPRPYVVKPIDQGSSVGVHIVREGDNLGVVEVAEAAFGEKVLVEKFVPGRELTVAVMGDRPVAVTELRPRTRFYDYEAKYTDGGMRLEFPARISATATERLRDLAARAFTAAGCAGLARADFFVDGEAVLLNELNTMPGQTTTSVYGVLWEKSGLPYAELMDELCRVGVARFERERALRH
jgi:D-alanine-D-alanine ligase